mgnify:CR=1 FL=1
MKIAIILQARSNSTRLKNKILKRIQNKTILEIILDRLNLLKKKKINIILATTKKKEDDKLVKIAQKKGCYIFRGEEKNVLSRFYNAAKLFKIDLIIRCNADCPLIDPKIILEMLSNMNKKIDYLSNILEESFPTGMHIEIFKFSVLKKAYENATSKLQKEHVTPYIYNGKFKIKNFKNETNLSHHRWTIDYVEDLKFFRILFRKLNYDFKAPFKKVLNIINNHPKIIKYNYHIKKKQNLLNK